MAKPEKLDLVSEIVAALPTEHQVRPWYRRLSQEQTAAIAPILEAWRTGRLGTKRITAARAISAKLTTLGIKIGPQGVAAWLDNG